MIVWDAGVFRNRTKRGDAEVPIERALEQGHVAVELHGQRASVLTGRTIEQVAAGGR